MAWRARGEGVPAISAAMGGGRGVKALDGFAGTLEKEAAAKLPAYTPEMLEAARKRAKELVRLANGKKEE